jgi:hypothetical protein
MTDAPFEDFRFPRLAPGSAPFSRLVSYGAAATTVLLLGGAATWGYRIAVRDVSDVPVIRALETPMRIAPETPGGDEAPYSGLAVNAVPGGESAQSGETALVLAAPPLSLSPEDAPGLGTQSADALAEPVAIEAEESVLAEPLAALKPVAPEVAASVTATEDTPSAAPLPFAPPPRPAGLRGAPDPTVAVEAPVSGDDPVAAALASVMASLGPVAVPTEIDPASLVPGTRLVQIGRYDDIASARGGWDGVAVRAGALIADKSRVIQPVDDGGRIFYRLRVAGFASEEDARRFCAVVATETQSCIPVIHR